MQKRYRPPREYLLFIASFIISVLCRYLSLYEINSRYMHLNEVFCLFAFLPKRIAQEALLTKEPTSHTTVRTDRYTAVQPHKCKDSYRSRMLQDPPHDGPLARPSHCRADSGLFPVKTHAHRAHSKKDSRQNAYCLFTPESYQSIRSDF